MTVDTSSASTIGASANAATTAISGLSSGIDTTSIINALMAVNAQTQTNLQNEQTANNTKISDYQTLNTQMLALQNAARSLQGVGDWQQYVANSSNLSAATATAVAGGSAGSVTFSVENLAQADVEASAQTFSSTSSVIASGPILVGSGGYALGLRSVAGDSSLALGSHTIAVTQASSGASVTGTAPAPPTTIAAGTNDTFTAVVNGQSVSYTLPPGTYSSVQLAAAIATASAGALSASVDPATGGLKVSTSNEGSAASLQITGGNALASLGLSAGSSVNGTDGIISVDGTSTTLTNLVPGASVSLPSGTGGNVTAVLDGHLAVGSMTASQVGVSDGSLSSVVAAINASNQGVSASAIRTGTNAYRLQLSSQTTGADARISIAGSSLSGVGSLTSVTQGQDALLHVGGATGYDVTSATNTIAGLMPGVNVTVTGTTDPTDPVTISSTPDASGMATKVNTFVTAANTLLDQLGTYGGYNATTQVAGDLMGDPALMSLRRQVLSLVSTVRTGAAGAGVDSAGVSLTSDGHLAFDSTAFTAAFNANPTGVAALFSAGGTMTSSSSAYAGATTFIYAPGTISAGAYDVNVTQSATEASVTGTAVAGSALAGAETLSIRNGSSVATFAASAGQSLQDVAAGLNAASTAAGVGVTASVVTDGSGSHLSLTSQNYGSDGSFDVSSTGTGSGLTTSTGSWTTYAGLDVAGTIGGVAATGEGQTLAVPLATAGLGGLALQITATGIAPGSSVDLGTFNYNPGVAAQMEGLSEQFADPLNGTFAFSLTKLNALNTGLTSQLSEAAVLLTQQRSLLQQQFDDMETAIAALKSTGDMLTSALGGSSSTSSS